jgi:hypothetical protein
MVDCCCWSTCVAETQSWCVFVCFGALCVDFFQSYASWRLLTVSLMFFNMDEDDYPSGIWMDSKNIGVCMVVLWLGMFKVMAPENFRTVYS